MPIKLKGADKLNIPWSIVITSVLTVIGWGIVNTLDARRDRQNKLRDIKVSYLIDAYRKLANAVYRNPNVAQYNRDLESVIADIQLFGTSEEIVVVNGVISQGERMESDGPSMKRGMGKVNIGEILTLLRNDLRKEINLDAVDNEVRQIRLYEMRDTTGNINLLKSQVIH